MSKKCKEICKHLSYIEHLLFLASTVTNYVSISTCSSLVFVPVDITSSVVGIKCFAIIAWIKKYKPVIKKNKKKPWGNVLNVFLYKHNAYKHFQPGISGKNVHMPSIFSSLGNSCFCLFSYAYSESYQNLR